MNKAIRRSLWALPILYMILIWVLSSLPSDALVALPDSKWDSIWKESMHLIEFAILYLLFAIALAANSRLTLRSSLLAAVIAALYGVADEIHQSFYSYRTASLFDVLKDWIGVLAAWGHVRYHYFIRKRSILNRLG
ncbi:MAG: VanZ family protein [Bacillus sp. (in: firmicutes)]